VASKDGHEVARDEVDTAGPADALTLTPETKVIRSDGRSLSYVDVKVVDMNRVMVPSAGNRITFDVTGAGTLTAVDNGNNESIESYHGTSRSAFHGQAVAILRSDGSTGPIQITAHSPGLLPTTATVYTSNATSGDVGVDRVAARAALGESPALPDTVPVVAADGSSRELPVRWNPLPAVAAWVTGTYVVHGTISGSPLQAAADVSVFDTGSVATYSTVTSTGSAPVLPATARVIYTDGVERSLPVTWAGIPPAQYASPGIFTVQGTIAGGNTKATASVRVTDDVTHDQNLALATSPAHPTGGTSFSGSAATIPAAMFDGITASGGWSNFFDKVRPTMPEAGTLSHLLRSSRAHPSDWVSVSWPRSQHFNTVVAYFTTSTTRTLPASVAVSYWDGTGWAPVSDPNVTFATGSNEPSTITFDPVATTKLKLEMTSQFPGATNGHLQISELQVTGDLVVASSDASLSDLRLNGDTAAGFDPATTSYTATSNVYPPIITAAAADNGSVAIQPPPSIPGTATVTVTSEDGLQTRIYSVYIRGRQG
jgi:beta-galactosidase